MMSSKTVRTLKWSVGGAVVMAILQFFSSKENYTLEKLMELPPAICTAALTVGMAYRAGLSTNPRDLEDKDAADARRKKGFE